MRRPAPSEDQTQTDETSKKAIGLELLERDVALLCGLRDGGLVGRPSFFQLDHVRKSRAKGKPLSIIAHEDVIVLKKITGTPEFNNFEVID